MAATAQLARRNGRVSTSRGTLPTDQGDRALGILSGETIASRDGLVDGPSEVEAPPFTPRYICALYDEQCNRPEIKKQDATIREDRAVRDLEDPVVLPPEYRIVPFEIRDPTATDEVERIVSTLTINWPKCTVTPSDDVSEEATTNATLRERHISELLFEAGKSDDGTHTFQSLVDAVAGDGGGWTKVLFTIDTWREVFKVRSDDAKFNRLLGIDDDGEELRDYDEVAYTAARDEVKKRAGVPLAWESIDTLSCYPIYEGNRLVAMLEISELPYMSTLEKYEIARDGNGNFVDGVYGQPMAKRYQGKWARPDHITKIEYWTGEWACYLLYGKNYAGEATFYQIPGKTWKHGYGRVPYFYAPGKVKNYHRNRKVHDSVIASKRYLVRYRSFLWTLHAQVAARDALPPFQRVVVDQQLYIQGRTNTPKKTPSKWNPREIIENPPGTELRPLQMPQLSQALREEIALVSEAIERLESPRINPNIGSNVEGAGFAINQLLSEARIRHDPLAQSVERSLIDITRFTWSLIRNKVGSTVWVYAPAQRKGYEAIRPTKRRRKKTDWIGLGPEQLEDTVQVRWRLDPERPSAKLIEARYWHERIGAKTASRDQAIHMMGDNPDEVRRGIAIDEVRESPWYKQKRLRTLANQAGAGDELQEAIAQQIAETGLVPGAPGQMGSGINPQLAGAQGSPQAAAPVGQGAGGTPGGMGNRMVQDMGQAAMRGRMPANPGGGTPGAPITPTAAAAASMGR